MQSRRLALGAALTLATALLLSACGSSTSGSTTSASTSSSAASSETSTSATSSAPAPSSTESASSSAGSTDAMTSGSATSGASGSSGTGSSGGSSSAGTQLPTYGADPAKALQAAYDGVLGTPPTTAAKPKSGVNMWVISCGEQAPSCATPVAAAKAAGESVGWKVNVCDGQLNPNGWGSCVRQAVAAKAGVVLPVGIDCASIQQPFQEAKDAGVLIVGAGGSDCTAAGGPQLMATERLQLAGYSIKQYWELEGKLSADYLIGKSNGQAKVLLVNFTDPIWGPWIQEGFKTELASCSGCSIVTSLDLANNDFVSNTAAGKFSTALLQASAANGVFVPVGGWMPIGLAQAVVSSGRTDLTVISGFGDASTQTLIRNKQGLTAVMGYASAWGAYGSVDEAIRVLNGEQPVVEGDGMQVVDADHNLAPEGKDYTPSTDFVAAYQKLWGVS